MKRRIKISSLLLLMAILIACGPKEPPNVSPEAHAKFISSKYIKAINEFQLAIEVAYNDNKISRENTRFIAQSIRIILDSIHDNPGNAKAISISSIEGLLNNPQLLSEKIKIQPYFSAVLEVLRGIKE